MRIAPVMLAIVLAGCSLDFISDPDEEPTDPDPPVGRCALGPRYHMRHTDCGPLPPDSPPTECWWTITVDADWINYCWSDVCEALTYTCRGDTVTGQSQGGGTFSGNVLPSGNLYWDGGGFDAGEYLPY